MKNYIILIIITGLMLLISYWLIDSYANFSDDQQHVSLKTEMAEIKAVNLKDFLLETPDILVLFVHNDVSEEFSEELLSFLRENNLFSEIVYLNTSEVEEEDQPKIMETFNVDLEKISEEIMLIVISDFEIVASFNLVESDYIWRDLNIFLLKWGYLDD